MEEILCPECKSGRLVRKQGIYETTYVDRDEELHQLSVPDLNWFECEGCAEVVLDDEAMSAIEAARRRALGLLTPQEIRGLRVSLNKTQAGMSELLGIGEKTYCRWESGAYMQSEGFDRYLRLLLSEPQNAQLLEEIAGAKRQSAEPKLGAKSDLSSLFPHLGDITLLLGRARIFEDVMCTRTSLMM
jgi:putative zinc finger/helix-turn-helix YgiT family protein